MNKVYKNDTLEVVNLNDLIKSSEALLEHAKAINDCSNSIQYLVEHLKDIWTGDTISEQTFAILSEGVTFLKTYVAYNTDFATNIYDFCQGEIAAN